VINHMQDCADDYGALDRVYLPGDWLAAADTTVEALAAPSSSPGLRQVIDRCLDGTERLLDDAIRLPGALRSRRLALESATIVRIAQRLTRELRRRDPVAVRVELTKPQVLACGVQGVWWVLTGARAR
jgi:phytoene/squalene synthetase